MSVTGAFQYWQRTMVHAGPGTVIRVPGLFEGLAARRVLLVSDAGLEAAGIVDSVVQQFDSQAQPSGTRLVGVYTGIAPDAEASSVDAALRYAREVDADALLAVGGGSVLDSVKMIKYALSRRAETVTELLTSPVQIAHWPEVQYMGVPHIAVPTTAGTGAELTFGAVVYNQTSSMKHLLLMHYLEADIAVLDGLLTTGLPPLLTAATGMDALTHAVESLAHPNINHFALAHASTAAVEILDALPKAVADGTDVIARQTMLNASAMACNSVQADFGAAPVHNFSHAIGAVCHIHHGEANAVLLPAVLETMPEYYFPVADRLASVFSLSPAEPAQVLAGLAARIRELLDQIGHPQDFSRHKLGPEKLQEIAPAIAGDPLAALHPLDSQVITQVCQRAFNW